VPRRRRAGAGRCDLAREALAHPRQRVVAVLAAPHLDQLIDLNNAGSTPNQA
jgi:hypothetical protein